MAVLPGLSSQLARLDRAVARLGPDGVVEALRRHLASLPPADRDGFLRTFEGDATGDDRPLLAEVDALVDELPRAVDELVRDRWHRSRRHRWDDWDTDDDIDDSPVAATVDDLYRRLGERFLAGDPAAAIAGYRRLFDAAVAAVDDPRGIHVVGSGDLAREAFARLLHGLLVDRSKPPTERAGGAMDALDSYRVALGAPTVAEVVDADRDGLVDDVATLAAWRDACEQAARSHPSWQGRDAHSWLMDLASRLDGPDGLARLAVDDSYPHRLHAHEAWIDQLEQAGRLDDAIAAATRGLEVIAGPLDRARLADRAVDLHRSAGDHPSAVAAGLRAVRDDPTLWRVRRVLDDGDRAGRPAADEVGGSADVGVQLVEAVRAHGHAPPLGGVAVSILAGRLDEVARLATSVDRHGHVEDPHRATPTVATGALLLACGLSSREEVATSLCERLVEAVDRPGVDDDHRHTLTRLRQRGGDRHDRSEPEPRPIGARLVAAIQVVPPDAGRLASARRIVERTAEAVLGAKERAAYATVAALVVALAHTGEAVSGTPHQVVVDEFDTRYRRFSAFRAELRDAARPATPAG